MVSNKKVFLSSSDQGVIRNNGRLGARLGPKAIKAVLEKTQAVGDFEFLELTSQKAESDDWGYAQGQSIQKLITYLKNFSGLKLYHLGGGHDHAYVFLQGLLNIGIKRIKVLNIDPHCDSRAEDLAHSGNPFRRITNADRWEGKIFQLGTNRNCNHETTLNGIDCMKIFDYQWLIANSGGFTQKISKEHFIEKEDEFLFISIDADVLDASIMEGVSAVSYHGICPHYLRAFVTMLKKDLKIPFALGIYEYNPLFDNLSGKGARYLASLLLDD